MSTQLQQAKAGVITEAMKSVAKTENIDAEIIRASLADGKLVIPANKIHLADNLKPCGIGRILTTKINANIGTSSVCSSVRSKSMVRPPYPFLNCLPLRFP